MANFIVVSAEDDAQAPPPGSLREAINTANANPGPDTITFAVTGVIVLADALPAIADELDIIGPGAAALAISGANAHRIFSIDPGVPVRMRDLTIRDGRANDGAAFANAGHLALTSCVVADNFAGAVGAGVSTSAGSSLTVAASTFIGNTATFAGGALFAANSTVAMRDTRLRRNAAGLSSGAIALQAARMRMADSDVSENSCGPIGGGAIGADSGSTVEIINSALDRNAAAGPGGAFINRNSTTVMTNVTIASNRAGATGGAVHMLSGTVILNFATVADNAVGGGAGLDGSAGTILVKNAIVASTAGGVNCVGNVVNLGGNFSTDTSCPGFRVVSRGQLRLGPLQVNPPGTTETMALQRGSVAIGAAVDCNDAAGAPVLTDQRGVARPQGRRCDAGAYEAGARRVAGTPPLFVSEGGCGAQRVRRRNPTLPFTR